MPGGRSESAVMEPASKSRLAARSLAVLSCALVGILSWCAGAGAVPSTSMLPDGRGWELVSPANKHGASIVPLGQGIGGVAGGIAESSEDGNSFTYAANAPIEGEPEANRALEGVQVLSKRSSSEWTSKAIITPNVKGEGAPAGEAQEYRFFTPTLSLALLEPFGRLAKPQEPPPSKFEEPPLAGEGLEERNIFLRHTAGCEPVVLKSPSCFEPLVTPSNDLAKSPFGEQLHLLGSSEDLEHAVFKSQVQLTSIKLTEEGGLYEWNAGKPGSEQLQLVNVLPKRTPESKPTAAPNAQLGDAVTLVSTSARNAISSDGSRVVWTSGEFETREHLYVRDTTSNVTIQVNKPQPEVRAHKGIVHFRIASADGSRVFFTDFKALTKESEFLPPKEGESARADLYVCELPAPSVKHLAEGEECKLKDLSVAPPIEVNGKLKAQSADVVGNVLATSSDGSRVYFVANAVLTKEAGPRGGHAESGSCGEAKNPEAVCNLYMVQYNQAKGEWEKPKFIALLSQQDEPDWAPPASGGTSLWNLTAKASSDGRYLTFMSQRELTGYNNVDQAGKVPAEEVFLFDAQENHLSCVSCNPSGAPPRGVFDGEVTGEGSGLLVDPSAKIWQNHWLAGSIPGWTPLATTLAPYQSRYLLDDGRVFFNSADPLVGPFEGQRTLRTELVNGTTTSVGIENVYEYKPLGVGGCENEKGCVALISSGTSEHESSFLDANPSGHDVFFLTIEQLSPADVDQTYDAYDARVCPCIQPPPPPPPPCSGEASCRTGPPSVPGFGLPGTSTFSGPGGGSRVETRPSKEASQAKTKTLTPLEKALRACRQKFKHSRKKRAACERRAKARFGHHSHGHTGKKK